MASPIITLFGGAMQAMGTIAEGNAAVDAAKAERRNLGRMASEELAVSTRAMADKAREVDLLQSRGQAVAAASGGGATDSTVLELAGNIARDANVQQRDILRTGQIKANDLMYKGRVGVANARFNKKLSYITAGGTLINAAADAASMTSTAYGKYSGLGASQGGDSKPWWG